MNLDALSDLVLLLVCVGIAVPAYRARPGVAIALGLVGLAAAFGVLRFSGVGVLLGPHRFASMLSACAAFPLLAASLRWPDAPTARRTTAASRFVLVWGGVGVALHLVTGGLWSQVVPGVAALVIVWTALQQRSTASVAGAALLVGSFVVAALGKPGALYLGLFNSTQALHYLLAAGLLLLCLPRQAVPVVRAA